jgi:hypothetical protein
MLMVEVRHVLVAELRKPKFFFLRKRKNAIEHYYWKQENK